MANMSINEYYNKFIELMRFAPEVVPTKTIKAQRFEQGLTLTLQWKLGGVTFQTLDEVYGRATHLYGIKGREMEHSGEKRKNQDSFHGGEKRHKPNDNHQGNSGDIRDNKGNFGKGNGGQSANARGNGNQRGEKPKRKYICKRCEKDHLGKEHEGNPMTFHYYQKLGYHEYQCFKKEGDVKSRKVKVSSTTSKPPHPNGSAPKVGTSSVAGGAPKGRVFVMNSREAETSNDVVIGIFLISSLSVKVLFDRVHPISKIVVESLGLVSPELVSVEVSIPPREVRNCSKLFRSVPLSISRVEFPSDLIEFDLKDLDVILGMDWLGNYEAKINCAAKKVTLNNPSKTRASDKCHL
ncbi:uncharacterized protein LOC110687328 [Chenopodium quinoa]|uniref:uncharacterized protein LOC110687328 n=1 Tax=Chenopodium quinoa TaxID=63459 RepID=UPI000B786862|nr:uncharacterized protein LOC110687328 [Chenopodium quinoa]